MAMIMPRPGPELFGAGPPRSPRRKLTPELIRPHLSDRPFEALLAAHPAAADDHPDRNVVMDDCRGGSRRMKASYRTEEIALAALVLTAARGVAQGAERVWAVYRCTGADGELPEHWHSTGWGERDETNIRLHTPAPSAAHPAVTHRRITD